MNNDKNKFSSVLFFVKFNLIKLIRVFIVKTYALYRLTVIYINIHSVVSDHLTVEKWIIIFDIFCQSVSSNSKFVIFHTTYIVTYMNQILIVEDETRLAAFVEKGLRKNGFSTFVVADGEQAIELAKGSKFDLLLLDLSIPVKNGWEVLRELRSQGERLPIIIMTARNDERDKMAAMIAGANDYVTKPFGFNDLLACVRMHLEKKLTDNQ